MFQAGGRLPPRRPTHPVQLPRRCLAWPSAVAQPLQREQLRRRVLARQHLLQLLDDVGVLRRHVRRLPRVAGQVVQLQPRRSFPQVAAHALPVADAHRLLPRVAGELPHHRRVLLLLIVFASQRRRDAQPVDTVEDLAAAADHLQHRRQHVREVRRVPADLARWHHPRPPCQQRHAQPALVHGALAAPQWPDGVEEPGVHAADVVRRPVVGREQHQRVAIELQLRQQIEQLADRRVHARDHGRVAGARRRVRQVALLAVVGRVVPLALVRGQPVVRRLNRDMRDRERQVQKERPLAVRLDERQRLLLEQFVRVRLARLAAVLRQLDVLVVAPQVRRVVRVRVRLAVVAEEQVEPAAGRVALRAGRPQPPLAHRPRRVALALHQLRQQHLARRHRRLPLRLDRPVVAHPGVPAVLARHQAAPRRRAHRRAGVELREPQPLLRHPVQARRPDLRLPVAAQLAVAQVIRHDQDNVRPPRRRGQRAGEGHHTSQGEQQRRAHASLLPGGRRIDQDHDLRHLRHVVGENIDGRLLVVILLLALGLLGDGLRLRRGAGRLLPDQRHLDDLLRGEVAELRLVAGQLRVGALQLLELLRRQLLQLALLVELAARPGGADDDLVGGLQLDLPGVVLDGVEAGLRLQHGALGGHHAVGVAAGAGAGQVQLRLLQRLQRARVEPRQLHGDLHADRPPVLVDGRDPADEDAGLDHLLRGDVLVLVFILVLLLGAGGAAEQQQGGYHQGRGPPKRVSHAGLAFANCGHSPLLLNTP